MTHLILVVALCALSTTQSHAEESGPCARQVCIAFDTTIANEGSYNVIEDKLILRKLTEGLGTEETFYSAHQPTQSLHEGTFDAQMFVGQVEKNRHPEPQPIEKTALEGCSASLDKLDAEPRLAILITNYNQPTNSMKRYAQMLKSGGVTVVVISAEVGDDQWGNIASTPDLSVLAEDVHQLVNRGESLDKYMCDEHGDENGRPCHAGSICFAIDQSSTIGGFTLPQIKNAVAALVDTLNGQSPLSVFSLVQFSQTGIAIVPNPTSDMNLFKSALQTIPSDPSSSNPSIALDKCQSVLASNTAPGPKVIVLVSDGLGYGAPSLYAAARAVKKFGTRIVTIGVGTPTSENAMRRIAQPYDHVNPSGTSPALELQSAVAAICRATTVDLVYVQPTEWPFERAPVVCADCNGIMKCYADTGIPVTDGSICSAISMVDGLYDAAGSCGQPVAPGSSIQCATGSSFVNCGTLKPGSTNTIAWYFVKLNAPANTQEVFCRKVKQTL